MALNINVGPERVQVDDSPIGIVQIPGATVSTAAILIATTKSGAPVNVVTSVTDMTTFEASFGDVDDMSAGFEGGYYAVKGYYDNVGTGNVVYIVNVGSSPTASSFIGVEASETGLYALDSIDYLGMVMVPGLPLEMAYLVQPALIDYAKVHRVDYSSTLSTAFSMLAVPKEIVKASVDTTLVTAQFVSVTGAGPYVIKLQDLATSVAATGSYVVVDYTQLTAATVTVAGHVLTEGVEWNAVTSNNATATSLASAISALTEVNATASTATVNIVAASKGVAGNSIATLTSDAVNLTVSGATLSGGIAGPVTLSSVTAGMLLSNSSGSFKAAITAVDNALDTVTIATSPSFVLDDDVLLKLPCAVTYKETIINKPSRVAAWYYNSVSVLDLSSTAVPGDVVVVDPIGHVAGVTARIDNNIAVGGPSHAPAGTRFAGLAGIQGLALRVSERVDAEPLRKNYINRITSFPGQGNVIFGGYTAEAGTSPIYTADERLVQVMRSLQFIKASLEPGLKSFIWENFSPVTQGQIYNAIQSFLRSNSYLFPAGLPESQQFKVISVTPTQTDLDNGLLKVRVQVKPNKAVRFIEVTLEYPIPTA